MKKSKRKYVSPIIISKKIKLTFFLSKISIIDQFSFVGNVYAQSSQCAGDSVGGCTGDGYSGNPSCNSSLNCD